MDEDKNKGSLLSISGVVVLLAALGVITFNNIPFQGSRPPVPDIREPFEKVRARLWQDPFLAVLEHVQAHDKSGSAGSAGQFVLHGKANNDMAKKSSLAVQLKEKMHNGKVTVLGVMVFGAPYAEETESRIRLRYAVLSGLRRSGFVPENSEHIDFITVSSRDHAQSDKSSLSNIMPLEWLANPDKEKDSVLLLWINDDVFQEDPLAKLRRLADCLGLDDKSGRISGKDVSFKVIGPAGSTTLKEMLEEASRGKGKVKGSESTSWVEIYSAMATVDGAQMLRSHGEKVSLKEADGKIEDKFRSLGVTFKRTIGSDRELVENLIEELRLRRVMPKDGKGKGGKDHIVLVAEWDTYYGRSLPDIYKEVLVDKGLGRNAVDKQVHRFSYLRGLDGSLPGDKSDKEGEKPQAKSDGEGTIKKLEQPMGKGQYDYLRRLAEEIYHLDQHLQVNKEGSIKAIGVLGSDFHDKYLVLQALRQRFPDAVFFTTDLDARLLHPDKIKWTRNLVVASNFNLALRDDIQGDVPPFRDNYQTSVFFAILQAFNDEDSLKGAKQQLRPRMFEIGRHKAFDLTSDDSTGGSIHPPRPEAANIKRLFNKIAPVAGLLGILLYFASVSVKNLVKTALTGWRNRVIALIVLIALCSGVILFYKRILVIPSEEPFTIFEGISIWPTVLLRALAIVLSLYFLWRSSKSLRKNNKDVADEFGFANSAKLQESAGNAESQETGMWDDISSGVKKYWGNFYDWEIGSKETGLTVDKLWAEYLRRDSWRYRVARLSIFVPLYWYFCRLIIRIDPPVSPLRGEMSSLINREIMHVTIILFIVLIFYVYDVSRTCRRFITIAENAPEWSQRSLNRFAAEVGKEQASPIREWMLVHLIAKRTDAVGKLIFYPFIVWVFVFFSRINYFDNWQTPVGLAIVISMGAVIAWSSAFVLRRSAERARTYAVQRLKRQLAVTLSHEKPEQDEVKRIEFVLNEVKSMREGAFAPFTQHPAVQALLVPFGGVGGVYLIEFLAKLNI